MERSTTKSTWFSKLLRLYRAIFEPQDGCHVPFGRVMNIYLKYSYGHFILIFSKAIPQYDTIRVFIDKNSIISILCIYFITCSTNLVLCGFRKVLFIKWLSFISVMWHHNFPSSRKTTRRESYGHTSVLLAFYNEESIKINVFGLLSKDWRGFYLDGIAQNL